MAENLDLEQLSPLAMLSAGRELSHVTAGQTCRAAAADRIVQFFYDRCRDAHGLRACLLVRCFQTATYAALPADYQVAADRLLADTPASLTEMRCLALLATRGVRSTWNDPATSVAHQAIPLPSAEVVSRAPMIARLLEDFGTTPEQIVRAPESSTFLVGALRSALNVFHIPVALGSPFVPAQASFVEAFGVRSVVGMGGLLPDGELFALLLFTRVPVARQAALLFQTLTTDVVEALSGPGAGQTFPTVFPPYGHVSTG